jgi:hypothetical protein
MELRSRAVDKVYKRRDRIDMPDYQREEVWSDGQKRTLIDSILRGWHLPKFYFRKIDDGSFECVDGQQRLSAIWEFFDGHLELPADAAKRYGGTTYAGLRDDISDAFDDFEIDIEELEDATDDDLQELFVRLQLGTPLTTAEKLNALGGNARDFARWMSDQPFFEKRIGVKDTRYAHFDIASKWMFVEARGIQSQMRFPQLEDFLRTNKAFAETGEVGKRIKTAMKYLSAALPDRAPFLRNRASVLSVCMLAGRIVATKISASTATRFGEFLEQFFSDLTIEVEKGSAARDSQLLRYQEAISYGSTGGESVRTRLSVLTQRLAAFDPVFAPLLAQAGEPRKTARAQVKALAKQVEKLVYTANERSAGTSGTDVFKMTTKSSRALSAFGSPLTDASTFGDFVDDLYFLVYEGTGDCKRLPSPAPDFAMDVKFLRNFLRHDLDHGDEKEAARIRKRGGQVFKRYTGKQAPGECSEAEFIAAQMGLLTELTRMLQSL